MTLVTDRRGVVERSQPQISVNRQRKLLGLSKNGLYYQPVSVDAYNLELMDLIDRQYLQTPFYGSRKMVAYLGTLGYVVNRKRVRRLMEKMGLRAIYPGKNTSKRNYDHKVYPYLLRGVNIERPNQVWACDITYLRLSGGFAYLVAITDWYSRFVLTWKLSNTLDSTFCTEAVEEALETFEGPEIFNTDQGCQFTSKSFTHILENHRIAISMDGKGRALDNVMIERIWRSLKYEEIYLKDYREKSIKEAALGIAKYFSFYNNERPHQSHQYNTPYRVYFGG